MSVDRTTIMHLVGVPHVEASTGVVFPAKGYVLMALLILAASHRMSRQVIAALLWDDAPEEKALTNLRQLMVRIHRCWPHEEALIATDGALLTLGPGVQYCDLDTILSLQKSTDLLSRVQSVLMSTGDLLDAIDSGGEELTQWLLGARERFRRSVLTVATDVLQEMTRFGRAQERVIDEIGERMLVLEPEREESYRTLIEAYARNGNLIAMSRTYAELTEVLRREFNTSPRPETAAAVRRILASAPKPRLQLVTDNTAANDADGPVREILAVRSLAGLPRVALFPPEPLPGQTLHLLHRALIEDVANDLSRHRTFAVIAPHSSFGVAETQDAERFAALRSGYIITGFMVPGTEQMALRLTRQPGDEIIWAVEYSVSMERLPIAFRHISRQIASTLAHEIERDQLEMMRVDAKPLAYRHYLEGQSRLQNCDLPKLRRARAEFKQAIQEDRNFAPAHARIAQTLHLEWLMLGGTDPYLLNQARIEADIAITVDPGDGVGHWMSGMVALYQRDFHHSTVKFLEAEALNPHSADLLAEHADALAHLGEPEEGWKRFQLALELNPMPPDHYWWTGASIAFRRRDFQGAIDLCRRMESDQAVLRVLAVCHALIGNIHTARQYGRRLHETYPGATALQMSQLAPDRRAEDTALFAQGLRIAGLD